MTPTDKKVIFSVHSSISQIFLMPITALIWKKFSKYKPIVLITGKPEEFENTAIKKISLDLTKTITNEINFIEPIDRVKDEYISQMSTMYCGCLDIDDNTYILTSKVNFWPLSTTFFYQQDWTKTMHLFNANEYQHQKYPICYCGAYAKIWRDILRVNKGSIHSYIEKQILDGCSKDAHESILSTYAELVLGLRIQEWAGYKKESQFIDIQNTRLDAKQCTFDTFNHQLIDICLTETPYEQSQWELLEKILKYVLNIEDLKNIINYRNEYIKLL